MAELQALKAISRAKESEEKRIAERRRNALVLILRHLVDFGYVESYERLSTEANLSLHKVDVADNIDIVHIIQEYEESYEMKFGKRPKLVKRLVEEVNSGGGGMKLVRNGDSHGAGRAAGNRAPSPSHLPPPPHGVPDGALSQQPASGAMAARLRRDRGAMAAEDVKKQEMLDRRQNAMNSYKPPAELGMQRIAGVNVDLRNPMAQGSREDVNNQQLQGLLMARQVTKEPVGPSPSGLKDQAGSDEEPEEYFERRVIKPLPASLQGELRDLGAAITRDIFTDNPNVRWEDISGLEEAKRLLKEAVVQPIRYPELFTGILAPWKGVLLYGPPGTGKTMLAKAVATECKTTFFNIQASSIISKWRGDSEKIVKVLFELARYHAPSTIFMDEIDALMMARGGDGEHEASRRMKTELLIQMDGLVKSNALVFVLCATNLPWELDLAMLRRLEKRILVPLPNFEARRKMFELLIGARIVPTVSFDEMADKSEGYSGSDVFLVAKEAAMRPLRRLLQRLDAIHTTENQPQPNKGRPAPKPEMEPITPDDVSLALQTTRPSAGLHEAAYKKFTDEYGSS